MDIVQKVVLLTLAIFVFSLATGGEYANNFLERKAQIIADLSEENSDTSSAPTELSFDIFKSVLQVSHLVFHSDLIFEFDLPVIKLANSHSIFDFALNFTNYHKTLFRSIISANAP